MGFGVDTASYLDNINWTAFYNWKGSYPSFSGRYFGGGENSRSSEFSFAKNNTNNTLTKIFPLQAQNKSRIETTGSTGNSYGQQDAKATLDNLVNNFLVAPNAFLTVPSTGHVNVYLDIENGTTLSKDYWDGWAAQIDSYSLNGPAPFYPCIYCSFVLSNGTYNPPAGVTNALNNSSIVCWGFYSSEPEPCAACVPNPTLNWNFSTYQQNGVNVPVLIWQYAETVGCKGSTCSPNGEYSNYAGNQNLDMDTTGSSNAENYMLIIS